ncbi:MAG: hypothetical protein ACRDA0_12605 [Cetobacterium sp.]|uniref:hypothetical protein n=1 Tax=Cetobacterium sp. TaxID=2071632 RepID=UPI003F3CE172
MIEELELKKHRNQKSKDNRYIYELDKFGHEEKYDDDYKQLCKETGVGFFETKKDIQVLAAMIGFNLYHKYPDKIINYKLDKMRYLTPVNYTEYYHLAYSVSICLEEDTKIILETSKVVDIFNKCSALGMPKLKEILFADGGTILENYQDFIQDPLAFLEEVFDPESEVREIQNSMEKSNWLS